MMQRVNVWLIVLIALGSLTLLSGCGGRQDLYLDPPPLVLSLGDCPKPIRPEWPLLDGEMPFDAPVNIKALLERDDMVRFYAKALKATIRCYEMRSSTMED